MTMKTTVLSFLFLFWCTYQKAARCHAFVSRSTPSHRPSNVLQGWLQDFFEPKSSSSVSREIQYPEQYPATYEVNTVTLESDAPCLEAQCVRPLLKNTQLERRSLQVVYDAAKDGWNSQAFHQAVDGKGAAVVLATTSEGKLCGGYNPKGWASLGGARPSVAAFLFYQTSGSSSTSPSSQSPSFQKLQKVGGGGLACARDDPSFGISFGPDGLVIGLQEGRETWAQSKLGPYFERGPENKSSLFEGGGIQLQNIQILVGCYEDGEEIPYSGGVLHMTSG